MRDVTVGPLRYRQPEDRKDVELLLKEKPALAKVLVELKICLSEDGRIMALPQEPCPILSESHLVVDTRGHS
jgi:hypothetical protein